MVRVSLGPRGQAVLILALVATLGALIGIVGDRFVATRRAEVGPPGMARMAAPRGGMTPAMRYGEGLAARLDLSSAQRAQIDSILAEERLRARELTRQFQPQFRALAEETRARVEAVLTPEQREQLRTMRQRMRRGGMRLRDTRPGAMRPVDIRSGDVRPNDTGPDTPRDLQRTDTVRQP